MCVSEVRSGNLLSFLIVVRFYTCLSKVCNGWELSIFTSLDPRFQHNGSLSAFTKLLIFHTNERFRAQLKSHFEKYYLYIPKSLTGKGSWLEAFKSSNGPNLSKFPNQGTGSFPGSKSASIKQNFFLESACEKIIPNQFRSPFPATCTKAHRDEVFNAP